MIWNLFLDFLKFILTGMAALYAALVILTLKAEGTHYSLKLDPHDPLRSTERVMVWVGVRTTGAILSALNKILNILEDTSAEVGEWVLHRRGF